MAISICSVTTIEECQAIEQLHIAVWGTNELDANPAHLLLIIAKEGGIVLLARDEEQPIGFSLGLLGLTKQKRLKIASHMTGVLPRYQSSGIGYQLKLAQREIALTRQLDLITWTFDPLQGRNAYLNLSKLGAVTNTYLRHLYGDMPDALNRGLPSDRFQVDWWIASDHVAQHVAGHASELTASSAPLINPTETLPSGFLASPSTFDPPESLRCRVQVPPDLRSLKAHSADLALQWRLHTRAVFETYIDAGYSVVDFIRDADRNYYLLQKDWQPL